MRDHDMGGWRFAHTIGLIQHTKAAHCVEEMWAIAEMNSNWKVWMASLIESKHAERQIIFWSRLFLLVLVGLSHCVHVRERESCQLQNYGSGSFFCHGREKRSLFVYLLCCQGANELSPPIWGLLSPSRLSRCWVSTATEAWNVAGSQAVQYEWPFCLISLSSVHSGRHVWLAAPYKSILPGTHTHT